MVLVKVLEQIEAGAVVKLPKKLVKEDKTIYKMVYDI